MLVAFPVFVHAQDATVTPTPAVTASPTPSVAPTPVPTPDVDNALKDLSTAVGRPVTTKEEARKICNEDKYITICAEIGKKRALYTAERAKEVELILEQLKGKVIDQLKACATKECVLAVATTLSQRLNAKDPKLAIKVNLTPKKVEEKKVIVQAVKDKEAEAAKKRAEFKAALESGTIVCGDKTVEGCTRFCLTPSTATIENVTASASATTTVPSVCREIAKKYFTPDVLKRLEQAHRPRPVPKPLERPAVPPRPTGTTTNSPGLIGRFLDFMSL